MDEKKKINKAIIAVIASLGVITAGLFGYVIYLDATKPVFNLNTDSLSIEAGDGFDPLDYVSFVKNVDEKTIDIDNPVQTGILGEYQVYYGAGQEIKALKVTVEDTKAPTFTVKPGTHEYYTDDKITPEDLIYTLSDETDVDVSLDYEGQNFTEPGDYKLKVVASDAAGNETVRFANIKISKKDTTPPEIWGVIDVVIVEGDSLDLMNGIQVFDDSDENPSLEIEGEYDKEKPGEYRIKYIAKDASDNEASAERLIRVEPEIIVPVERPAGIEPFTGDVTNFIPQGGSVGWDATGIRKQPYLVAVNRAMNTVTVYGKDENGNYTIPVKAFACSVGCEGHETITGTYKTTDRFPWCYMVDGTWGRYAIRISGGYMFHSIGYYERKEDTLEYDEFNKLGTPASLGCVRLCLSDIYWLYAYCPTGFRTVIYDDYESAGPLGKPTPPMIDTSNEFTRGWDPTDPEYPY